MLLFDTDGSLTGNRNDYVVASDPLTINNAKCRTSSDLDTGVSCTNSSGWIRLFLCPRNYASQAYISDSDNHTAFMSQSYTWPSYTYCSYGYGPLAVVEANRIYKIDNNNYLKNIQYDAMFYDMKYGQYLIIQHSMYRKPDQITIQGNSGGESSDPLTAESVSGSWYWDISTRTIRF